MNLPFIKSLVANKITSRSSLHYSGAPKTFSILVKHSILSWRDASQRNLQFQEQLTSRLIRFVNQTIGQRLSVLETKWTLQIVFILEWELVDPVRLLCVNHVCVEEGMVSSSSHIDGWAHHVLPKYEIRLFVATNPRSLSQRPIMDPQMLPNYFSSVNIYKVSWPHIHILEFKEISGENPENPRSF